jgi:hypothetical protein
MFKKLAFLILLLPLGPAGADIYKHVLPDGTVVFSDQPGDNATKVEPVPLQTYTAPAAPPTRPRTPATNPTDESPGYSTITITAPVQDEVIWDNNGVVAVDVDIQPPLRTAQGHHFTLLLDGQKVTDFTDPPYTLQGVDRGTHSLQVDVRDGETVLAESQIVEFHLKRHIAPRPTPRN